LAEQLIDAIEQIEHALKQYEGDNQRTVQKLADTKEQLDTTVGKL
jgi:molecular chaperone GrpE (heat shock protein)